MKDGSCLTDRKSTHMEAHGSTLILTVDDEPTNHLVIEEIVTSQGYQVLRTSDSTRLQLATYLWHQPCTLPAVTKHEREACVIHALGTLDETASLLLFQHQSSLCPWIQCKVSQPWSSLLSTHCHSLLPGVCRCTQSWMPEML